MKITALETIRLDEFPNVLFVEVFTDNGRIGLGETFLGAEAVAAYLHESVARLLIGEDAEDVELHTSRLTGALGRTGTGVEMRGKSAVNIALWDLIGQEQNRPLYDVLGGAVRDHIRIYNTCAGYRYIRDAPQQAVSNWGLPSGTIEGPFEDLYAFLHHADDLARSLLEQGITGMKIWPFDAFAEATHGHGISTSDLDRGVEPLRKIRDAVGTQIDIMVELHSLWDLPSAERIAHTLEELAPLWIEDPMPCDNLAALTQLAESTSVPLALSETLGGAGAYLPLLASGAVRYVICDLSWAGGISEALKVAALADAHQLPITLHDCTGPVVLTASAHLAMHLSNAYLQETVRASYTSWYRELVTDLPEISGGFLCPPPGPGLGTQLVPGLRERRDAHVRRSGVAASRPTTRTPGELKVGGAGRPSDGSAEVGRAMTRSETYGRDGYLVIDDLLDTDGLATLRAESVKLCRGECGLIDGLELPSPDTSDEDALRRVLCIHFPHKISAVTRDLLKHPGLVEVLCEIVGPDIKAMQSMLFVKAEGRPGQAWHQDEYFIPTRDHSLTAAWIALDDATVENGCLWVLPGSQEAGVIYPERKIDDERFDCSTEAFNFPDDAKDAVPIEVPAGAVVLFDGYLLHRSLPNTMASGLRRSIVSHYMSARSLLPWGVPHDGEHMAIADDRDIVMITGNDPYAYKGLVDRHQPFLRPDREGGCHR